MIQPTNEKTTAQNSHVIALLPLPSRKFATKDLGCDVGVCDVVKNSLPEKVLLKSAWISVKRRFALRRAVKMMPSRGRHLPARHAPQIPQAQLPYWLFRHNQLGEVTSHQLLSGSLTKKEEIDPLV